MNDETLNSAEWLSKFYAQVAKGGTPQLLLRDEWKDEWGGQYGPRYPDLLNCDQNRWRIKPVPGAISHPARLRGINNAYRSGEWGDIITVRVATPEGLDPRAVFVVQYDDDVIDSIPIWDSSNYEIE